MPTLRPLADCVIVEPEPPPSYQEYKKYTHIIVPDKYEHGPEDRAVWGKVLASGNECKNKFKQGDRIVFGKWAGARITHQDKKLIMVREDEVLAVDE